MLDLKVTQDSFKLKEPFTISRGTRTHSHVVTVHLHDGAHRGMGECVPYARYGETMDSVVAVIEGVHQKLGGDLNRQNLQKALKPGAARNALDCALWDLEIKQSGNPIAEVLDIEPLKPVTTAFTLSLETPEQMHAKAKLNAHRPLLKIKLGGEGDLERLKAVRAGAPNTQMIVDANEGWSADDYQALAPVLLQLGVAMVEQPMPAGEDDALRGLNRILPVCADESCHDRKSLPSLQGKYDMINIKLDKTGGLTEAIQLKQAALDAGFQIMVGCMVGSSLAMAPAIIVAQGAAIVDLDGPLLLGEDRDTPLIFDEKGLHPSRPSLWG